VDAVTTVRHQLLITTPTADVNPANPIVRVVEAHMPVMTGIASSPSRA
jgi:hypothetical protein